MADSSAVRVRRSRAHKSGDHSLCHRERCAELWASTREPVPMEAAAAPLPPSGGIAAAVQAFVAALPYPPGDHRAILGEVAVQLARRVDDTGAVPAAVRELRVLLSQLTETPNSPPGKVDELRLRRAQRHLDAMVAQSG